MPAFMFVLLRGGGGIFKYHQGFQVKKSMSFEQNPNIGNPKDELVYNTCIYAVVCFCATVHTSQQNIQIPFSALPLPQVCEKLCERYHSYIIVNSQLLLTASFVAAIKSSKTSPFFQIMHEFWVQQLEFPCRCLRSKIFPRAMERNKRKKSFSNTSVISNSINPTTGKKFERLNNSTLGKI